MNLDNSNVNSTNANHIDLSSLPLIWQPYADKIRATITPCVNITLTATTQASPWASKVGSTPYLPLDVSYPTDSKGKPMDFLAQINFADVPALPDYPTQGILSFFISYQLDMDYENPTNQANFRVLYFEQVTTDVSQLHTTFPETDPWNYISVVTGCALMGFTQAMQPISYSDFAFGKTLFGKSFHDFARDFEKSTLT